MQRSSSALRAVIVVLACFGPALAGCSNEPVSEAPPPADASTPPPPPTCTDNIANGSETDVDCGGACSAKCADGRKCLGDTDCTGELCDTATKTCAPATCSDGLKNASETGIDCGGSCPTRCGDGKRCLVAADCVNLVCNPTTKTCSPPSCSDGVKNGQESDVDCGGTCQKKCADTQGCATGADCTSGLCDPPSKTCFAPNCTDGTKNGTETDTDCGGSCPQKCAEGKACNAGTDCATAICDTLKTCAAPSCSDNLRNGSETDVDCGGGCPQKCANNKGCQLPGDCSSGICDSASKSCQPASCTDGIKNGAESDADCGGTCPNKCVVSQACRAGSDCQSAVCGAGSTCAAPSCADGVRNGTESDVDCGAACPTKCPNTASCAGPADCQTGVCDAVSKKCKAPSCSDGLKNQAETDVDCGGPCQRCAATKGCAAATDCTSGVCDPATSTCAAPVCTDTVRNGAETDVDCGGGCPNKCAEARGCATGSDCTTGVCDPLYRTCLPANCRDGVKNSNETDIDCGGSCARCAPTKTCLAGTDCTSLVCDPGTKTCTTPSCTDGIKNGNETDQDCGGSCAAKCADAKGCFANADCQSGVCDALTSTCKAPSCSDNVKNGTETGKDCGGGCSAKCPDGEGCTTAADCQTNLCTAGVCGLKPTLSGISPACGPTTGGTTVTFTGTGFGNTGTWSSQFGAANGTSNTYVSASTLTAVTPPGAAGKVDVSITGMGATMTLAQAFSYVDASAAAPTFPTTAAAYGYSMSSTAAVGDITGDGKVDFLEDHGGTHFDQETNTTSTAGSTPVFSAVTSQVSVTSPGARRLLLVDVSGDGKVDTVFTYSTGVSVTINSGSSINTTRAQYATGNSPEGLVAVDLNGDGKLDVAVLDSVSDTLTVLLNGGTGTFTVQTPSYVVPHGTRVVAGDFNGDGKKDVVASSSATSAVTLLLGNGDGTFDNPSPVALASSSAGLVAADFNLDGKLDLAVANGLVVSVLLGNGAGAFSAPVNTTIPGMTAPAKVLLAQDFDGNGTPDLVVMNQAAGRVELWNGLCDGTFASWNKSFSFPAPTDVAVADFNLDAKPDVFIAGGAVPAIYVRQ